MDDIAIDEADRKTINAHKGYSIGFNSEVIAIREMEDELINRFQDYLPLAKAILIIFDINEDQTMFDIGDVMELLNNRLNQDCEIIFGTQCDENIELGKCRFHIEITGLDKLDKI